MAVPTQSPTPPSYSEHVVRRMEHERKMLAEERFMGWATVWTLFGFKVATVAIIVWLGRSSSESGSEKWWAYLISTSWYWIFIPVVAISGFIVWRLRLREVRKKADLLRRSEFSIPDDAPEEQLTEEEKERLRQVRILDE